MNAKPDNCNDFSDAVESADYLARQKSTRMPQFFELWYGETPKDAEDINIAADKTNTPSALAVADVIKGGIERARVQSQKAPFQQ